MSKMGTEGWRDHGARSLIRARRLWIQMSQQRLADALGISRMQVHKYEIGVTRISPSRLAQIAEALGVGVPFFFERSLKGRPDGDASKGAAKNNMPPDHLTPANQC